MKGLIFLSALFFLRMEHVQAQLNAETQTLWLTEGRIPYFLVFQDSIVFFDIGATKDDNSYERIDTLYKIDSKRYLGKRGGLLKVEDNWSLELIDESRKKIIFKLATNDQYKAWMSGVNWFQWQQMFSRAKKLFPEKYRRFLKEFITLENRGHSTPILEYQREVQDFEMKYLYGK